MRKINQHKRTYYKELSALTTIITAGFICFLVSLSNYEDIYIIEQEPFMAPVVVEQVEEKQPTIEDKIKEYFPRSYKTIIAVAHAESNMSMEAIGYNCYYNKNRTIVYETRVQGSQSTSCKKEHRIYAWSVDCFVLQRNYQGRTTCPEGVTLDMHLKEVSELSKIQGLNAWSSFNNKSYQKYLTQN